MPKSRTSELAGVGMVGFKEDDFFTVEVRFYDFFFKENSILSPFCNHLSPSLASRFKKERKQ